MSEQSLRWRGGWAHLDTWRGRSDVAYLALGTREPPTSAVVDRCLHAVAHAGYRSVVTSALSVVDAPAFIEAGFSVRERLHLLTHDLAGLPRRRPDAVERPLRRARSSDREPVLELDARTFLGFWRLDRSGLTQALDATPSVRFRVSAPRGAPVAYGITGRAGREGYLQRVAVDPAARASGWGRAVVMDGLAWLRRRGATRALVNTQLGNDPALGLYRACGFRELPIGLCVLGRTL